MNQETKDKYTRKHKANIKNWLSETIQPRIKDIVAWKGGGSGVILKIEQNGYPSVCLKIIREEKTDSINEHKNLIREIYYLLLFARQDGIIPILNNEFNSINDDQEKTKLMDDLKSLLELKLGEISEFLKSINELISKNPFLKKILYLFSQDESNFTLGYVTPLGKTLEEVLLMFSSSLASEEYSAEKWLKWPLKNFLPAIHIDESNMKFIISNRVFNIDSFLDDFIEQILKALKNLHSKNIVHLDIKEANIMILPREWNTQFESNDPARDYLVIFDLGSANEIGEIRWDDEKAEFETTFQYLPKILQKTTSLSKFTSHKKAPIKWKKVKELEITATMIDLHSLSQIILNIIEGDYYPEVSSNMTSKRAGVNKTYVYEKYFAFSELLSIDFQKKDQDSLLIRDYTIDGEKNMPATLTDNALTKYKCSKTLSATYLTVKENITKKLSDSYSSLHPAGLFKKIEDEIIKNNPEISELICALLTYAPEVSSTNPQSENEKTTNIRDTQEQLRSLMNDKKIEYYKNLLIVKFEEEVSTDFSIFLQSKLVNRLIDVRQLGLTYLNNIPLYLYEYAKGGYAQHSRFEHSIGTLLIIRLYILYLIENSPWFRFRYNESDGILLMLIALLHDVGHYPFAHILEDSNVFPNHNMRTEALLHANCSVINVKNENQQKKVDEFKNRYNLVNDIPKTQNPMPYYDYKNFIEFWEILLTLLKSIFGINDDKKCMSLFQEWYTDFLNAKDPGIPPKRLISKVFYSMISGPIDADKINYIAHDSINCGSSLGSLLEGTSFEKFLRNLRIPYQQGTDSSLERYCLGINEDTSYLPQILFFLRVLSYAEIYWSSESRKTTALLRFLLVESISDIWKNTKNELSNENENFVKKYIHDWINGTDRAALESFKKIMSIRDVLKETEKPSIGTIWEDYINGKRFYEEICVIYPSDVKCYDYFCKQYEPVSINDKEIKIYDVSIQGLKDSFVKTINNIICKCLDLKENTLQIGDTIIDIPAQRISKKDEFTKFALVDQFGTGIPVGGIWKSIEDYAHEKLHLIRIFIKTDIKDLDNCRKRNIRNAIINRFR